MYTIEALDACHILPQDRFEIQKLAKRYPRSFLGAISRATIVTRQIRIPTKQQWVSFTKQADGKTQIRLSAQRLQLHKKETRFQDLFAQLRTDIQLEHPVANLIQRTFSAENMRKINALLDF